MRPCGKRKCPAAIRLRGQLHYLCNREVYITRAKNRPSEKTSEYKRRWKERNPSAASRFRRERREALKKATPPWLTKAMRTEMNAIYKEARRLGHHVDHIVPLRGGTVCGLHVPWNLRVLPGPENMKRPRKFVAPL